MPELGPDRKLPSVPEPESAGRFSSIGGLATAGERRQWSAALVECCREAMIGLDLDGTIVSWNPAAERLFGFAEQTIVGRPAEMLVASEGSYPARDADLRLAAGAEIEPYEARWRRCDGRVLEVLVSQSPVTNDYGLAVGIVMVVRDIGAQKSLEAQLRHLAERDALTGLYSRRRFDQELHQAVARSARHEQQLSIAVIDLDGLKRVNDTLGHRAGDQLLRAAAGVLARRTRAADLLARVGGDEFAVILPHANDHQARILADNLLGALRQSRPALGAHKTAITASIGIATLSDDSSPERLYEDADRAMYSAKRQGGDRAVSSQVNALRPSRCGRRPGSGDR